MSPHTSFIPPNVSPPEPPEGKAIALFFSVFMSIMFLVLVGFVCVEFLADTIEFPLPSDTLHDSSIREECGPFISEFLGLSFPGQFAPMFGKNARRENYYLTEQDQELALKTLRDALHHSETVSVEFFVWDNFLLHSLEKCFLSYDHDFAEILCKQADSMADTFIAPLDYMYVPDIVFVFYPSEVHINMIATPSTPFARAPLLYVTLEEGMQRWEGNFGDDFMAALLDLRLQSGETVRSRVSDWIPDFPLDSLP